jgi:hypothetical protein
MSKLKTSVSQEWKTLFDRGEHLVKEESGEIYKVQPVDLETFVMSPDYLGQYMWGMSKPQREFLSAASDFDNNINFFVLFVG